MDRDAILPKGTAISQKDYFREGIAVPLAAMRQAERAANLFLEMKMPEDAISSLMRASRKANEAAEMTLAHHLGRETLEVLEYQGLSVGFSARAQELRISLMGMDKPTAAIVPVRRMEMTLRR
ncbi:MAG: hypothetical protein KGH58_03380 [Candidatus Micrarchaeota archaeon]|nr:hypothetical protein [Candidatus Micrarchaeota archaeon]